MKLRCLKRGLVRAVRSLPPVPESIFDVFIRYRVGSTPPDVPEVVYVSRPGEEAERMALEDLPPPRAGSVRLVVVSDTHERHAQVSLPEGDVLLHCGDILMSSSLSTQERGLRVLQDFNSWLQAAPCKEKVVIGGNHDWALERLGREGAQQVLSSATLLRDDCAVLPLSGIKVYGNAFSRGHSHNVAWQTRRPEVSDACVGADVVMTHESAPCIVTEVLEKAQPCLWASGHCHAQHGVKQREGLTFVNAAILDTNYCPLQPPIVVDLPRKSPL